MGNRVYLTIGNCCRFDANNILPVTWLAPFAVADRVTEHRKDHGDEWYAHLFRVNRETGIDRLDWAISQAAKNRAVWQFLKPMSIIRDEIAFCGLSGQLELEVSEFVLTTDTMARSVDNAPQVFHEYLVGLTGDTRTDVRGLNDIVQSLQLGRKESIADSDFEYRMFLFLGDFEGSRERMERYPLQYFNEAYWLGDGLR